jgi:hypothetical protein
MCEYNRLLYFEHAGLIQNLAEEFEQFRPVPTREEINCMLNQPQ